MMRKEAWRPSRSIPGSMTDVTSTISGVLPMGWATWCQTCWQQMGYTCLKVEKGLLQLARFIATALNEIGRGKGEKQAQYRWAWRGQTCIQMGVGLFSQVTNDRMRGNDLKLHQDRFRLEMRVNFFMERVIRHWNRQSREVVQSPSSEVFKRWVDAAYTV